MSRFRSYFLLTTFNPYQLLFLAGIAMTMSLVAVTRVDKVCAQSEACCSFYEAYRDGDNDDYTIGGATNICANPGLPAGWKLVQSSVPDCYDNNSAAKPGQTSFFTTERGDGSFDYDCNGTSDKEYTATSNCQ